MNVPPVLRNSIIPFIGNYMNISIRSCGTLLGVKMVTTMFMRMFFLILLAISASSTVAFACEDKEVECGQSTNWYDADFLEMTMRDGQGRGSAHWVISIDKERNDIIIEKDEHYDGKDYKGTLMIISGRMMLTKGLNLQEGYEIDAADGPGLMMQLLLNMLGRIAPDGPESINGKFIVDHTEKEKPIKVSTASASGVFGVPWTAKGVLEKRQENVVDYEIEFESALGEDSKYSLKMSGKWESIELEPLKDSMSLEGWKVYTIGPYTRKYESGTILDYGAQTSKSGAPTIGALRKEIEMVQAAPSQAPRPTQ